MGNFILSVILIISVVAFVCVNSVIICNICDEIISLIDEGSAEAATALWNEKQGYISLFVRDAEVDVVSACADGLKLNAIEDGEARAALLSLREAVSELKNSERLSFNNVF